MKDSLVYRFTTARDTVPFDLIDTQPAQNGIVSLGQSPSLQGTLTFNDYVYVRDSILTIDPPATIFLVRVVSVDGGDQPFRRARFAVLGLQPDMTYTMTIPRGIADYEGETLPRDHQLVFHTQP